MTDLVFDRLTDLVVDRLTNLVVDRLTDLVVDRLTNIALDPAFIFIWAGAITFIIGFTGTPTNRNRGQCGGLIPIRIFVGIRIRTGCKAVEENLVW